QTLSEGRYPSYENLIVMISLSTSPPETLKDDSETVIDSNNDYSSSDNDSLYSDDIDLLRHHLRF
ncbi:hypothetical protein Tco_0621939, partial [Tanacetum coccineum]